jgi:DNA invertase Pin-like site-specific DNA recombinase
VGVSRVAIYTRGAGARDIEEERRLIAAQRAACELFARAGGSGWWQVLPDRFDDAGCAGDHGDRLALGRLLAAIDAGSIHVVLATRIDRLFTSFIDVVRLVDRFEEAGAVFYAAESVRFRHTGLAVVRRARGVTLRLPEEVV